MVGAGDLDFGLACDMVEGGLLFGVDKEGNPLFADGGLEPIICGLNYDDTLNAVMFMKRNGKEMSTGYEMFPYSGLYEKSDEILAFEAATGEPFIRSEDGKKSKGSWLAAQEVVGRRIEFDPEVGGATLGDGVKRDKSPRIGVRRLLRVKKA